MDIKIPKSVHPTPPGLQHPDCNDAAPSAAGSPQAGNIENGRRPNSAFYYIRILNREKVTGSKAVGPIFRFCPLRRPDACSVHPAASLLPTEPNRRILGAPGTSRHCTRRPGSTRGYYAVVNFILLGWSFLSRQMHVIYFSHKPLASRGAGRRAVRPRAKVSRSEFGEGR